jgi:DNA-binding NarL/FixJ family response regulator
VIRVLVAGESAVVRAGLEAVVSGTDSLALAGSSSSVAQLPEQIANFKPDVVLIEIETHDVEKMAALAALANRTDDGRGVPPRLESAAPAIVILAADPLGAWTAEALQSGVSAVLPREASAAEFAAAVEAASAGLVALHLDVLSSLLAAQPAAPLLEQRHARDSASSFQEGSTSRPAQALTPREIQVLGMLAEGLGNKEIAWRLHISEHTVKFHIASIFNKLDANSRTEAVTLGIRLGLIVI